MKEIVSKVVKESPSNSEIQQVDDKQIRNAQKKENLELE